MTIIDYYTGVLKKYAVFTGRARRAEYWYFVLANLIISIILGIISGITGDQFGFLSLAYGLAIMIPSLAVAIRRLHDIGKSGWWIFICLIPLIGWIWLIILYATEGVAGDNQYGPNPKAVSMPTN